MAKCPCDLGVAVRALVVSDSEAQPCLVSGVQMPKYLVKVGLNYPPDRRAEAGDVVEDLPSKSIKWLRDQGCIELLDANGKSVDEPIEVVEEVAPPEVPAEEPAVVETPVVEEEK